LFSESEKNWKKNVVEMNFEILLLSQFTLQAITKKGSKPDFHNAMETEASRAEFSRIAQVLRSEYSEECVKTGRFQAVCNVSINNDGPVTIILDSKNK
jgi:D-tyrosyl-tRNA(Tyr) deacylase